jgi:hypothetical protein
MVVLYGRLYSTEGKCHPNLLFLYIPTVAYADICSSFSSHRYTDRLS